MNSYHAMRDMSCFDEDGKETQVSIRWDYTVSSGSPQTYGQPEEYPEVDITRVMVSYDSPNWFRDDGVAALATVVFGGDEAVEDWLLSEAMASAEDARDEAGDHKRQMQREDAL